MDFGTALELAQAIEQRNAMATGLSSLHHGAANVANPTEPIQLTMISMAQGFVDAQRRILKIVEHET